MSERPLHKWEDVAAWFRDEISSGRILAGDRVAAERDLAETWGVSRMTVHRALRELQGEGFVVRRRGSGTVVAAPETRRTQSVALLYHNNANANGLEAEYIRGARASAPDELNLLLCDHRDDPQGEAELIERMRSEVDGLILIPSCAPENTAPIREALASGLPLVCVDRVPPRLDVDAVITDNYTSTLAALRSVVRPGQRMAHFTADIMHMPPTRDRHDAYIQVCREIGDGDPHRWVRRYPVSAICDRELITQLIGDALLAMLHAPNPPTVAFCMNDFLLMPVLDACDVHGIRVPDDLEVVSYNDAVTLTLRQERTVHRIVQQTFSIGGEAVELLLERLRVPTKDFEVIRVPAVFHPADTDTHPSQSPLLAGRAAALGST